jgi:hypothetical protein
MSTLPTYIQDKFYSVLTADMSLREFEQWLYADKKLEQYLPADDYLEIISLDYRDKSTRYTLWKLLKTQIDLGDFETYKLLRLLQEAQQKNERLPAVLIECYDLYCRGYEFLQDLGLGMGLSIEVPMINGSAVSSWQALSADQQNRHLESLSPLLEECIADLVLQLKTKKIVLTGELDENGFYVYEDFRTEAEKKSKYWLPVTEQHINKSTPEINKSTTRKIWWIFRKRKKNGTILNSKK